MVPQRRRLDGVRVGEVGRVGRGVVRRGGQQGRGGAERREAGVVALAAVLVHVVAVLVRVAAVARARAGAVRRPRAVQVLLVLFVYWI